MALELENAHAETCWKFFEAVARYLKCREGKDKHRVYRGHQTDMQAETGAKADDVKRVALSANGRLPDSDALVKRKCRE